MMSAAAPAPGSPKAIARGCICSVGKNQGGLGAVGTEHQRQPVFVFNVNCPLHGGGDWLDQDKEDDGSA